MHKTRWSILALVAATAAAACSPDVTDPQGPAGQVPAAVVRNGVRVQSGGPGGGGGGGGGTPAPVPAPAPGPMSGTWILNENGQDVASVVLTQSGSRLSGPMRGFFGGGTFNLSGGFVSATEVRLSYRRNNKPNIPATVLAGFVNADSTVITGLVSSNTGVFIVPFVLRKP